MRVAMSATAKVAKDADRLRTEMGQALDKAKDEPYLRVTREQFAEWFCTVDWIASEVETIAEAEDIYNGTR
jgi:hypothetical protein